jgi:putative membrane protein
MVAAPLVLLSVLTWAFWRPADAAEKLDAAIVNLDEPVTVQGQYTPMGRQLAAELVGAANDLHYNWIITTAEDAAAGLSEGRYVAQVTIPANFSAAVTSFAGEPSLAHQATIMITTSPRAAALDDVIAETIVQAAVRGLSQQVTSGFLDNVFLGFNDMAEGLGEAADGAGQLADGTVQAYDGAGQLASGANEAASGLVTLAAGSVQAADGAYQIAYATAQVASGASQLAGGVQQLGDGLPQLRDGIVQLNDGLQQIAEAAPMLRQYSEPVQDGAQAVSDWVDQLQAGGGVAAQLQSTVAQICADAGQDPAVCAEIDSYIVQALADPDVLGALDQVDEWAGQLGDAADQVGSIAGQVTQLADGLEQVAEGSAMLEEQTRDLVPGVQALSSGAVQLASGAQQTADGAALFAASMGQLSSGAVQAAYGINQLASGTQSLADGLGDAADGAAELAAGLDEAVAEIPEYSESDRSSLKTAISEPIVADQEGTDGLASLSLYAALALWLGAVAIFLVLPARPADAFGSRRPSWLSACQAFTRAAGPAAVQGAVVGLAVAVAGADSFGAGAAAVLAGLAVALAFTGVIQGLTALLGRPVSRVVAIVAAVTALGPAVLMAVPGALTSLAGQLPTAAAGNLFQAALGGPASAGWAIVTVLVWGLAGLGAAAAAIGYSRSLSARSFAIR